MEKKTITGEEKHLRKIINNYQNLEGGYRKTIDL